MEVVWIHTYNTSIKGGGIFMLQQIKYLNKYGINVQLQYINKLYNPFYFVFNFFKYHNRFKSKIIHAQYGSGTAFFSSLLKSKKKIVSLRGSDWYVLVGVGSLKERIRSRISHFLTCASLHRFDEIIVMSERMKYEILNFDRSLENKVKVIIDGIDTKLFFPLNKDYARLKLGIKNDIFLVGVGSIDENNSIKRLANVRTAVEVLKKEYDIDLLILTNINHLDMNLYINSCDVMVLTSVYEGWPNIIKEGLACNVPFVATDVSDLHLIASDKTSGCLISDYFVNSIANNILKIYENKMNKKPCDTRRFISKFSMDSSIDLLLESYNLHC